MDISNYDFTDDEFRILLRLRAVDYAGVKELAKHFGRAKRHMGEMLANLQEHGFVTVNGTAWSLTQSGADVAGDNEDDDTTTDPAEQRRLLDDGRTELVQASNVQPAARRGSDFSGRGGAADWVQRGPGQDAPVQRGRSSAGKGGRKGKLPKGRSR